MQVQNYKEIKLSDISSNPNNPRKNFKGPKFNELVDSIRQKGIIEPIIIRPISSNQKKYEVVAGERRFKAACLISRNKHVQSKIPVIIKELSDDEAFDFMIIENLQREDLTGFEEALGFKKYFKKKGKGSIPELANRIGKSAGYIRRKIAILSLPKNVLEAWEKKELQFSHLEQLRRLKNKEELKDALDYAVGNNYGGSPASKRELKEYIDNMAPPLNNALFNIKEEGCTICGQNSDMQQKQWDIGAMKGTHCLDKTCFKQKQNNFLLKKWKNSKYRRKFGTNGFRFRDSVHWGDYRSFDSWGTQPAEKCKTCDLFLTIINLEGEIEEGKACFGEPNCYGAIGREVKRERIERGDEPRVAWHGEYFRERFFEKRIPEKFQDFKPSTVEIARLILFSLLKSNHELLPWFCKKLKITKGREDYYSFYHVKDKKIFDPIQKMDFHEVFEILKEATLKVILQPTVTPEGRLAAADHLGINLAKEWAVTEEYLQKKTIREMIEFGEKSRIFNDKKIQDYLINKLKKKPGRFDNCKKAELIELFLKSGVNLVGKVPDEILLKGEKK